MRKAILMTLLTSAFVCWASAQSKSQHNKASIKSPTKEQMYNAVGASGARVVRDSMLDPESFRVTGAWLIAKGPRVDSTADPNEVWVCFVGRSKNRMGGYEKIVAEAEGYVGKRVTSFVMMGLWEDDENGNLVMQSCTSSPILVDVTDAAQAALKEDRDKM